MAGNDNDDTNDQNNDNNNSNNNNYSNHNNKNNYNYNPFKVEYNQITIKKQKNFYIANKT